MLFGYIVVLVFLAVNALISFQSSSSLVESQEDVTRTYEIISKINLLQKTMNEMQSAVRGYLLTGHEEYLQPYHTGEIEYENQLNHVHVLVAQNKDQLRILENIDMLVQQWQKVSALPLIENRKLINRGKNSLADLSDGIQKDNSGRRLFTEIRDIADLFVEEEKKLLEHRKDMARKQVSRDTWIVLGGSALAILLAIGTMLISTGSVLRKIGGEPEEIAAITKQIAHGDVDTEVRGSSGILGSVAVMLEALRENRDRTQREDWLKSGIAQLNEKLSGDPGINELAARAIAEICRRLDAQLGVFYVASAEENESLMLIGSYAYTQRKSLSQVFGLGEGLIGQAALEKQQIIVRNVPEDYTALITSGLGERPPGYICVTPLILEGHLKGVIEVASLEEMTANQLEYLRQSTPILAIAVESAQNKTQLSLALEKSQQLAEELQVQQEELKASNEELEAHTAQLQDSEERLTAQHENLELLNAELEEKNQTLEIQRNEMENARSDIMIKAEELAQASKYKSEFLANMSHELRTPLNSLLLLSHGLTQNKDGNLSKEQIQSAKVIHSGGTDLLNLINEILDLSKIEAGRMDLHVGEVRIVDLADSIRSSFAHMAAAKGLEFDIIIGKNIHPEIRTDHKRLEQILRNLLSNAIKFSKQGKISISFHEIDDGIDLSRSGLKKQAALALSIEDTGIGIAPEQHKVIFEAFQQADGGTSREYGGTGLGLSISRELARLLGGEIQMVSELGKGSRFTVYLPLLGPEGYKSAVPRGRVCPPNNTKGRSSLRPSPPPLFDQVEDDRTNIVKDDRVMLIVEDDPKFAAVLCDKCRQHGFKCLIAGNGEMGLNLALEYQPVAIVLDIRLPGIDGWEVLATLKEDIRTRHIPIHVISVEEASNEAIRRGAVGHVEKPISPAELEKTLKKLTEAAADTPKRVLVVEDDETMRDATVDLIGNGDVQVDVAITGGDAIKAIADTHYDCVVVDLGLPDMEGSELLAELKKKENLPPVIIHTARELSKEDEQILREYTDSIVIKDVRSQERLLDEVSLFLHRVVSKMPEQQRVIIRNLHDSDEALRGKKVLIVDDDMRTTFAMSRLLEDRGMRTLKAEDGSHALKYLDTHPDIDIVLMDIMMPSMDGYEAMARIRAQKQFKSLPILALTAKAMPEDREKCLAAGANDYLPKPVEEKRLLSMMRIWLYR